MEYKLRDMSWSEFAERSKTAKTIILPSGACEVYGPHNPLGADILVAKKMSEMLAERVNGIVGPCLEVGRHLSRVNAQKSKNIFYEARMRAISSRKSCSEHR